MKGQFFVMSTVIMIFTLMAMTQYIYDFSNINLVQLKQMTELDSIQYIKDVLNKTVASSSSDCNKLDTDLNAVESFLENEMISRGINLTVSHTILSCSPVSVYYNLSLRTPETYVFTDSTQVAPPSPYCGDGICNNGETQGTCCTDCGCPLGQSCNIINQQCYTPSSVITFVQGPKETVASYNPGSFEVDFDTAPTSGDMVVLAYAQRGSNGGVSSISETGVTWNRIVNATINGDTTTEIWAGNVSGTGGTAVTVNINSGTLDGAQADIAEFSGVNGIVDRTNSDISQVTMDTGTTSTTNYAKELVIGAVGNELQGSAPSDMTSVDPGYTLLDGISRQIDSSGNYIQIGYVYQETSSTGQYGSAVYGSWGSHFSGAIATFW